MKSIICKFVMSAGYKDTDHFLNSTFHPHYAGFATGVSTFLASLAYYFNTVFGIQLPVGIVLIILFFLEMYTGIKASAAEKKKFDSELFGKGWLKLLVYMIMIGCSHVLSTHIPVRSFYSWKFNIYEWLHYAFYNFVIINLIWSNLENFKRLGWTEYVPVLKQLAKYMKDEPKKEE
jgi:phage-related holin